jgi:hypothetical protein
LEARFVEQDEMGLPPLSPLLRLPATPAQPSAGDLADVLGVMGDAGAAADDLAGPSGIPEFVAPAVGLGPSQQQPLKLPESLVGETGHWPGMGLGG